jgi:hypothetical protein
MLGHDVRVFCWSSEVRPELHAALDRFGDDWIRMTLHHAADSIMDIEVLVAVHIPDVLALTALKVDRIRGAALVAGGDAANQRPLGTSEGGGRSLGAAV